jgi:hypothetical protein
MEISVYGSPVCFYSQIETLISVVEKIKNRKDVEDVKEMEDVYLFYWDTFSIRTHISWKR